MWAFSLRWVSRGAPWLTESVFRAFTNKISLFFCHPADRPSCVFLCQTFEFIFKNKINFQETCILALLIHEVVCGLWASISTAAPNDKQMEFVVVCLGCRCKESPFCSLNNRNLCYHNSGHQKSNIKVSVGLVSLEGSLLGEWITCFSLCPHLVFPLYMSVS